MFLTFIVFLQKHGASIEVVDADNYTAIQHAINGNQFEIVEMFKNIAFERKQNQNRKANHTPRKMPTMNYLAVPTRSEFNLQTQQSPKCASPLHGNQLTPHRKAYNFDSTSPYYINITHRGNKMKHLHEMKSQRNGLAVNLFKLTRARLEEFTRMQSEEEENMDNLSYQLIEKWRRKVDSISKNINDHRDSGLLSNNIEDWSADLGERFPQLLSPIECAATNESHPPPHDNSLLGDNPMNDESNFIHSPNRNDEFMYQMTEKYVHQDSSAGISVFEKKVFQNNVDRNECIK